MMAWNRKRGMVILVSATVVAGLLSACTSGPPAPNPESEVPTVLRFGASSDAGKNLNPITAANQFVGMFLAPAYDTLISLGSDGDPAPGLATAWQWSEDGLSLSLALRDDVKFHDGERFDASAVKTYLDHAMNDETSTLKGELASIDSVTVDSEFAMTIKLKAVNAALPAVLTGRAGMIVSPAAVENADLDRYPVGTGPYVVTQHDPGVTLIYEKFADYHSFNEQAVDTIEMLIQLDPDARLRNAVSGTIDVSPLSPNQIETATQQGANVVTYESGASTYTIFLNKAKTAALSDATVRQAMSMAVDRAGIAESLLGGLCAPTGQLFPEGSWYASNSIKTPEYDIEAAKKLLKSSAYPDGFSMSITSVNVQPYSTVVEAVGRQLSEIGIDVDLQITEPAQVISGFTQNQAFDAYGSVWPGAADPAGTVSSLLMPSGLFNPGGYADGDIEELAAQGLIELDPAKRATLYQQIDEIASGEMLHLPLCQLRTSLVVAEGVSGVEVLPNGWLSFRNVVIES